jgi:hypothetical protein
MKNRVTIFAVLLVFAGSRCSTTMILTPMCLSDTLPAFLRPISGAMARI